MKANEAPERIYMTPSFGEPDNVLLASFSKSHLDFHRDIEYIRKDVVDDMLATAEDHAYFAGSERAKEKIANAFIEKACDAYCKICGHYAHKTPIYICRHACNYYDDFKRVMKGE